MGLDLSKKYSELFLSSRFRTILLAIACIIFAVIVSNNPYKKVPKNLSTREQLANAENLVALRAPDNGLLPINSQIEVPLDGLDPISIMKSRKELIDSSLTGLKINYESSPDHYNMIDPLAPWLGATDLLVDMKGAGGQASGESYVLLNPLQLVTVQVRVKDMAMKKALLKGKLSQKSVSYLHPKNLVLNTKNRHFSMSFAINALMNELSKDTPRALALADLEFRLNMFNASDFGLRWFTVTKPSGIQGEPDVTSKVSRVADRYGMATTGCFLMPKCNRLLARSPYPPISFLSLPQTMTMKLWKLFPDTAKRKHDFTVEMKFE